MCESAGEGGDVCGQLDRNRKGAVLLRPLPQSPVATHPTHIHFLFACDDKGAVRAADDMNGYLLISGGQEGQVCLDGKRLVFTETVPQLAVATASPGEYAHYNTPVRINTELSYQYTNAVY